MVVPVRALASSTSSGRCEAAGDLHRRRGHVGVVDIGDRHRRIDRGGRLVFGVVQRAAGRRDRGVVDRRDVDGVGLGDAVGGAVIGDDGDGAGEAGGILAVVEVGDRVQRGLVVRDAGRAVQGQGAGAGIERAGDAVLGSEAEHVLAVGVVAGDLHRRGSKIGVVDVGHGNRRIDHRRRLVLGVVQGVAGGHHRRVVDRRDMDGFGRRRAVEGAVIGDDGDGAGGARGVVAAVEIGHRGQRGLVVRNGVGAGQGQRAGRRIEGAGNAGGVGEAEHVLAVDVVA